MVKIRHIIIAVLVATIGMVAAVHCSRGEEKKVRRRFVLLSKWVSRDPGETTFTMARRAQNIGTLFAESCGFEARIISFSGRYAPEEISSYATQARLQFSKLSLRFYDLDIEFPEKEVAKATLTARLTGTLKTGEHVEETHELKSVLKKVADEWLFRDFEVVEVLEK